MCMYDMRVKSGERQCVWWEMCVWVDLVVK